MFNLQTVLKNFYDLPQPDNYEAWVKVNDEVTVHTMGRYPSALRERRPGEPDDVFEYRKTILKPITKGSINKGFDNLYRIFQNTSWSFIASKTLTKFLLEEKFQDQLTFKEYTEKNVLRVCIEDPNAVLCWYPETDEAGQYVSLKPRLYNSRKIRYKTDDAIMILDEQVEVASRELLDEKFSDKKRYNKGKKYLLISKTGIWSIEIPKGQQDSLIVTPVLEMEFDQLPVITLGGNKSSAGYYESFFGGFIPFGDEALMCFSDHQAVNVQFSYPVREEKAQKCDAKGCKDGKIINILTPGQFGTCSVCKGSGYKKSRSPWGVYITKEDSFLKDEKTTNVPAVQFHSPDSAILAYSSEEWRKFKTDAEAALHLVFIDQVQSGAAKKEDQRPLYALLQNIGDNYYENIIFNSLDIQEQMLNSGAVKPVVYKPAKYQIFDDQDPITTISQMIAGGTPKHLIIVAIEQFLRFQYNESNPIHVITAVLIQYDPFFAYTPAEKERMLALGVIDINDYRKSAIAYPILRQLSLQLADDFIHTDIETLVKKLEAMVQPLLIPVVKPAPRVTPAGKPIP